MALPISNQGWSAKYTKKELAVAVFCGVAVVILLIASLFVSRDILSRNILENAGVTPDLDGAALYDANASGGLGFDKVKTAAIEFTSSRAMPVPEPGRLSPRVLSRTTSFLGGVTSSASAKRFGKAGGISAAQNANAGGSSYSSELAQSSDTPAGRTRLSRSASSAYLQAPVRSVNGKGSLYSKAGSGSRSHLSAGTPASRSYGVQAGGAAVATEISGSADPVAADAQARRSISVSNMEAEEEQQQEENFTVGAMRGEDARRIAASGGVTKARAERLTSFNETSSANKLKVGANLDNATKAVSKESGRLKEAGVDTDALLSQIDGLKKQLSTQQQQQQQQKPRIRIIYEKEKKSNNDDSHDYWSHFFKRR